MENNSLIEMFKAAPIVWLIGVSILGFACGILLLVYSQKKKEKGALLESQKIIDEAKKKAEIVLKEAELEAKDNTLKYKTEIESELKEKKEKIEQFEARITSKEEVLEKKFDQLDQQDKNIRKEKDRIINQEKEIKKKESEINNALEKQKNELLRISGLNEEQAKERVLKIFEEELEREKGQFLRKAENEAKTLADKKARNIIVMSIQRQALDQCQEHATKLIPIPGDEMKGRIIGREGRNIRAFEQACGIDLIVDDTPDAILISCFDPVRREIGRLAIEKLMADGRFHPARIEEVVKKARTEIGQLIKEGSENALLELGLSNIHPEIMKLIGQLQFRTSYGQQQLKHSMEVSQLAGLMAGEIGINVRMAKRAGFLHDIGKALTHEIEGSHAMIGADLCRKYGESADIEHAVRAHHRDVEPRTVLAFLTDAADAMSGGRPGARSKTEAAYIQRLEQLETICMSFKGVQKSYAVQAGRDLRIMVNPDNINDERAGLLAREVSKRIEDEMQFPGQIKVSVIRETRAVEYAQ